MEYKSEDDNGDSAWYKLVGDRNIPVKVSRKISVCSATYTEMAINKHHMYITTYRFHVGSRPPTGSPISG